MRFRIIAATAIAVLAGLLVPAGPAATADGDTAIDTQGVAMRSVLLDGDTIYALQSASEADGTYRIWSGTAASGLTPLSDTAGNARTATKLDSAGGGVLVTSNSTAPAAQKFTVSRGPQLLAQSTFAKVVSGGDLWAMSTSPSVMSFQRTTDDSVVTIPQSTTWFSISGLWAWSTANGSMTMQGENVIDHSTKSIPLRAPVCGNVWTIGQWDLMTCGANDQFSTLVDLTGTNEPLPLPAEFRAFHAEAAASVIPSGLRIVWYDDSSTTEIPTSGSYSTWDVAGRTVVWIDGQGTITSRVVPASNSADGIAPLLSAPDVEGWSAATLIAHPLFADLGDTASGLSWFDIHLTTPNQTLDFTRYESLVSAASFDPELKDFCVSMRAHDRAGNASAWSAPTCHRTDRTFPTLVMAPWIPIVTPTSDPAVARVQMPAEAHDSPSGIRELTFTHTQTDPMGNTSTIEPQSFQGDGVHFADVSVKAGNSYCVTSVARDYANLASHTESNCYDIPWDDSAFRARGKVRQVSSAMNFGGKYRRLTGRGSLSIHIPPHQDSTRLAIYGTGGSAWVKWPESGRVWKFEPATAGIHGFTASSWATINAPAQGGTLIIQHRRGYPPMDIDAISFHLYRDNRWIAPLPFFCLNPYLQQPGC